MDYRRNEDMIFRDSTLNGPLYNAVLDLLFVEDSGEETEPVTLAEALQQCNIDDLAQDNSLVESYITTARQQCEGYTGIGFMNRTIQAVLNNSLGFIELPYGPVGEVISVNDIDDEDQEFKLSGIKWKALNYPVSNRITVEYTAGYSTLPQVLKTALLQQVAYLYEHRGDETKLGELSPVAKSLLQPLRRV